MTDSSTTLISRRALFLPFLFDDGNELEGHHCTLYMPLEDVTITSMNSFWMVVVLVEMNEVEGEEKCSARRDFANECRAIGFKFLQ